MFKPKTTITGRLENSSGEPIRTTDLRVMRVEPEIVTFDLRVRVFYEPCVRWFRRATQTSVALFYIIADRFSFFQEISHQISWSVAI